MKITEAVRRQIFEQRNTTARLELARLSTATAALRIIAKMPPAQLTVQMQDALGTRGRFTNEHTVRLTKAASAAFLTYWAVNGKSKIAMLGALSSYCLANHQQMRTYSKVWSYNTHLIFQMAALGTAMDPRGGAASAERQSAALSFMQLFGGLTYFQAGLSKCLHGGPKWMATGDTLHGYTAIIGTNVGRRFLSKKHLFVAMSWATILFELGYLPALLASGRAKSYVAGSAIAFHNATDQVMGISFWHLWSQFPALFFLPTDKARLAKALAVGIPAVTAMDWPRRLTGTIKGHVIS